MKVLYYGIGVLRSILYRIVFHLFGCVAVVVLFAISKNIQAYFIKEPIPNKVGSFFNSKKDAKLIAHLRGKPTMLYPLAKPLENKPVTVNQSTRSIPNKEMDEVIKDILALVSKDFIQTWYKNISTDQSFITTIDNLLYQAVSELYFRTHSVDANQLLLVRIIGIITQHAKEVALANKLMKASNLSINLDKEELQKKLATHYCQGKLHPAISASVSDTTPLEYAWLRKRIKPYLALLFPKKEISNGIVMTLVREILVTCLLCPLIKSFSDPDYWNQNFDILGGMLIEQYPQTHAYWKPKEFINDSIDPSEANSARRQFHTFEAYCSYISSCDNLPGACKIRNDILAEIQQKETLIAGCAPDDIISGTKVSKTQEYLNQLSVALKRIDKVILKLNAKAKKREVRDAGDKMTLNQVLEDPVLRSYFEDFMDTNNHLPLVEFAVAVNQLQENVSPEKPIQSMEDEYDTSILETFQSFPIAIEIRRVWLDFFAPDSHSNLSPYISKQALDALNMFIDCVPIKDEFEPSEDFPLDLIVVGVKAFLVIYNEVINFMKVEDYPLFLRHPLGAKALAKFNSFFSNKLRGLLRNRSPERQDKMIDRSSFDSERHSGTEDDSDDTMRKKSSMLNFLNRKGSLLGIGKMWQDDQQNLKPTTSPILTDKVDNVEGEMQQLLNTDDEAFGTPKSRHHKSSKGRPHSFMADFSKLLDSGNKLSVKKSTEDLSSGSEKQPYFKKKHRSLDEKDKIESANNNYKVSANAFEAKSAELEKGKNVPGHGETSEKDIECFIRVEIEDIHPVSVDENIPVTVDSFAQICFSNECNEIEVQLGKLRKELDAVDIQIKELETSNAEKGSTRMLLFTKRGISHEIHDLMIEKRNLQKRDIDKLLQPSRLVEKDGRDFALYPIKVSCVNADSMASHWIVYRRYNQFVALHHALRAKFPAIMHHCDLPGKMILSSVIIKRSVLLENRRVSLEKYLIALLKHAEICKYQVFKQFIYHPSILRMMVGEVTEVIQSKKSFMQNVFQTVDDSIDTIFQRKAKPPLFPSMSSPGTSPVMAHEEIENPSPSYRQSIVDQPIITSTAEPIIDLFVEIFELKGLRRQAVVIFLQNLFGDTVERRLTLILKENLTPERILGVMKTIKESYWPNGEFSQSSIQRNEDIKTRTRVEASNKLATLFPEIFGGMVGRQNARRGAIKVCQLFQNPILNQHLLYRVADEILFALFPNK
ncbi:Intermediate filament protein [Globomyces sp. JEL0801]|nr:Intermediate filament protein [Globomyces sp. JEL0801]